MLRLTGGLLAQSAFSVRPETNPRLTDNNPRQTNPRIPETTPIATGTNPRGSENSPRLSEIPSENNSSFSEGLYSAKPFSEPSSEPSPCEINPSEKNIEIHIANDDTSLQKSDSKPLNQSEPSEKDPSSILQDKPFSSLQEQLLEGGVTKIVLNCDKGVEGEEGKQSSERVIPIQANKQTNINFK